MTDLACTDCGTTNTCEELNQEGLYTFLLFTLWAVVLLLLNLGLPALVPSVSVWRLTFGDLHPSAGLGDLGGWLVYDVWRLALEMGGSLLLTVWFLRRVLLVPYRGFVCTTCGSAHRLGGLFGRARRPVRIRITDRPGA